MQETESNGFFHKRGWFDLCHGIPGVFYQNYDPNERRLFIDRNISWKLHYFATVNIKPSMPIRHAVWIVKKPLKQYLLQIKYELITRKCVAIKFELITGKYVAI